MFTVITHNAISENIISGDTISQYFQDGDSISRGQRNGNSLPEDKQELFPLSLRAIIKECLTGLEGEVGELANKVQTVTVE